jgi:hypothetical protein
MSFSSTKGLVAPADVRRVQVGEELAAAAHQGPVGGRVVALEREPPAHVDAGPGEGGVDGVLDVAARAVLLGVGDERAAADPGVEVALWVTLALCFTRWWLVHFSLI